MFRIIADSEGKFNLARVEGQGADSQERENKGRSLLGLYDDYVAIDLETTGLDPKYEAIIEIGALRVIPGKVTTAFSTLVNPEREIPQFVTELTGITNSMVETAPSIDLALRDLLDFTGTNIVVAHNANFDINFIYDTAFSVLGIKFTNDFVDTMRLSRRLFKQFQHHRLIDLAERFGIEKPVSHRAMDDACQTYACYEYMKQYMGDNNITIETLKTKPLKASDISTEAIAFDESSPIYGKVFVFTGTLEKLLRKTAMQAVADMGGTCKDSVTTTANFLVLGNGDYNSSVKDGISSKHKKAIELAKEGHDIQIISENVFYDMLSEE